MDLLSLVATLGLDTSPFEKGLLGIGKGAIKLVNKAIGAAASAVVDFGKDVLETGMDVDKTFSAVQAVLGKTEGTAGNMSKLMENAQDVAKDSIFTLKETGDAYYYMGMAGWKTDQMLAGLPGVINLAAASGEDLAKVSDIVTDSLTGFGLGAGQAEHFADVLAVTATNANTDVARMGQTFKYLAPVAGALSYSIEDIAASVGLVANSGIKGSMAGTSLRNIFTRIATNAGETKNKLGALSIITEELGVDFYDASGKARPWLEVVEDARKSWKKLDPGKADIVAREFGNIAVQGQDASQVMNDFASDLDAWTTEWNGYTTDAERQNFAKLYGSQFAALGISLYDSKGKLREFNDVAAETRIRLGGLNDEQKLYYGQQIGNLRGMTTWLSLMNASEADFQKITGSIRDAAGAAEDMANTRLDNLWGDVQMFNSRLDILKYAIFDDIKGPLRDVVQYATEALDRITKAISKDGLEGGIRQLGIEIEGMANQFAPMLESLGKALVPLFTTLINGLVENVGPALVTAGSSLASGIFQGIETAFASSNNPIISWIRDNSSNIKGLFSNSNFSPVSIIARSNTGRNIGNYWNSHSLANGAGGLTSASLAPVPITVSPQVDMAAIQKAVQDASNAGNTVVSINGVEYSTDFPDVIAAVVQTAIDNGTTDGFENFIKQGSAAGGTVATAIQNGLSNAGQIGGELMTAVLGGIIDVAAPGFGSTIAGAITNAGTVGGPPMFSNVLGAVSNSVSRLTSTISNAVSQGGSTGGNKAAANVDMSFVRRKSNISSSVSSAIGSAGNSAGNDLVNKIQRKFSLAHFAVNVIGNLITSFTGGRRYAKAMNTGRILHGAQVFGVDNTGSPLIGGEAGNEAIVGTTELERLIAGAVAKGNGGGVNAEINIYQQPGQDPRELAEIIQRELVRIGRQKRAVYA